MTVKTSKAVKASASNAENLWEGVQRPRLHQLTIRNFRCIGLSPVTIDLDDIVVLVGPNNVGKSSILRAYEVVTQHGSKEGELEIDDFPNSKVDDAHPPQIDKTTFFRTHVASYL
jgi:putative ATP-dependent endonuclease of the OLD family